MSFAEFCSVARPLGIALAAILAASGMLFFAERKVHHPAACFYLWLVAILLIAITAATL